MQAHSRNLTLATALVAVLLGSADAQSFHNAEQQIVVVGPNVQVSEPRSTLLQGELMASSDPKRPGRLMACSLTHNPSLPQTTGLEDWGVAVYLSDDAGKRWRLTFEQYPLMDPACTYGGDGTLYLIAFDNAKNIELHRSPDGGETWEPPTFFRSMDRPYLTVDHTRRQY